MPGLYGVVATHENLAASAVASRMAERMRHHPWYVHVEHQADDQGVAFGRLSIGGESGDREPGTDNTGKWVALLSGEIHDCDRWRQELEGQGSRFASGTGSEILAQGFSQGGTSFLRLLSGSFNGVLWNAADRRLVLVNDRFGMRPLYFTHAHGRLLFASELKALFVDNKTSRAISARGMAQLFMFGQLWNNDTLCDAIRMLPAGAILEFDADSGRCRIDRYRTAVETALPTRTLDDALGCIDEAFGRAMTRCVSGAQHLGISLSGGLDSRTVLAGLGGGRDAITTVSMGVPGSIDHKCAEEMARIHGSQHHSYVYGSEFLAQFLEHFTRMVRLTDGHYISQCVAEPSIPLYRSLGIDVLLRGHAGELMHLDKAYNFSIDRAAAAAKSDAELEAWLMRRLTAYVSGSEQSQLFAGRAMGEMADHARESLRESLRDSAGMGPLDRISHLFLTQRLRRETSLSLVQFDTHVETRVPLLDGDLVDALFASPAKLRIGDRIQAHLIARRRPELLKVINANTGAPMGVGAVRNSVSRFRMKVLRKLGVPGYQPYEKLGLWLRRELQPIVHEFLLSDRALSRGVFHSDRIRQLVQENREGRANHTYLILVMMVFEMGQRLLSEDVPLDVTAERLAAMSA